MFCDLSIELENVEAKDAVLDGEIVLIVFRHSIEQIPQAEFAIKLLRIAKSVEEAERIYERLLKM